MKQKITIVVNKDRTITNNRTRQDVLTFQKKLRLACLEETMGNNKKDLFYIYNRYMVARDKNERLIW